MEVQRVRYLIPDLATIPEGQSRAQVLALSDKVKASPKHANVLMGKFIDRHRFDGDYGDVILN